MCVCVRYDPDHSCAIVIEGGNLLRSQKPGPEPQALKPVDTRHAATAFKHAAALVTLAWLLSGVQVTSQRTNGGPRQLLVIPAATFLVALTLTDPKSL